MCNEWELIRERLVMNVSFFPAVFYPAGSFPYGITAADFNGDGWMDLAVAGGSANNIGVLLGNGNGTFQAPQFFPVGSYAAQMVAMDFNDDSKIDLAVTDDFSGDVAVLINNTFKPQPVRGIRLFC